MNTTNAQKIILFLGLFDQTSVEIEPMKRLAIALKQAFNQESIGFEVVKSDFTFV